MADSDAAMAAVLADPEVDAVGSSISEERRAHTRIPKTGTLTIFPCKGEAVGRSLQVSMRDVSRAGIGLVSPQSLDESGGFIVALKRGTGKATVMLYAIRRQFPVAGGIYIGAELQKILRDNEIKPDDDSPLHRVGRATLRVGANDPAA